MAFHLDDVSAVPHKPGVYFFYDKKNIILYIGKAKDLKNRVKQYFAAGSVWKQDMLSKAARVDFVTVSTESEALYLEDNLIKKHKPIYNSLLKGDNSYVYIKITKDPYPLVFTTRTRVNDGSIYLGPKHFTRDLYKLMQFLRKLLRYRGCGFSTFKQGKICGDYHFGTCKGRCVYAQMNTQMRPVSKIDAVKRDRSLLPVNAAFKPEMTYEESLLENKKLVALLVDFFAGKTKPIQESIMDLMKDAVAHQHFEYAGQLRDIYAGISLYTEKQHVVISQQVTGKIMKVREMEGRYVLAIVNMYEGKMIDVIRLKYRTSDTQIDDIVSDFRSEYGEAIVEETGGETRCFTTTLKKIPKKTRTEIEGVLDKFIDGMIASSTFEKENIMNDLLHGLEIRYSLPRFPYAIECIDISHLSGGRTSGALVAMKEGLLNKKGYRRYKIKGINLSSGAKGRIQKNTSKSLDSSAAASEGQLNDSSDDYASLREIITRRFHGVDLENDPIPDMFILDGGKGQLGIVKEMYENLPWFQAVYRRIHFCALGKGDARKRAGKIKGEKEAMYRFDNDWKIQSKEVEYDDVDRIMLTLRDEAHRFANKYRKKQMSMEWK